MAMRELVTGGAACAVPGQSSSSNPFGALANALIGSSSKQEGLKEIPSSTPTASEPQFYPDGHGHLQQLPGSELDQPFMQPRTQSSEFLRNFNSVDGNRLLDNAWDEIQSSQPEPMHVHQHDRIYDMRPHLQPTLDGPPQRVLSSFLHSFVESSRGGMPFRPTPLPVLGLSAGDKQCIRDRTSIMARHFFADKSEDFINGQVNALLSSLDIDSDVNSKGPLPARFRELDDYWNESQAITKPGAHAAQGWVTEFSQHRLDHGDPNTWAHSFERQPGANGWASEFEQRTSHSCCRREGIEVWDAGEGKELCLWCRRRRQAMAAMVGRCADSLEKRRRDMFGHMINKRSGCWTRQYPSITLLPSKSSGLVEI